MTAGGCHPHGRATVEQLVASPLPPCRWGVSIFSLFGFLALVIAARHSARIALIGSTLVARRAGP